jgi:hypothetical protein
MAHSFSFGAPDSRRLPSGTPACGERSLPLRGDSRAGSNGVRRMRPAYGVGFLPRPESAWKSATLVFAPKIQTATCHVPNTHGARAPKTAFFGAPAQNTRTPEYHTSRNGILDFSLKNAITSNEPGFPLRSRCLRSELPLLGRQTIHVIVHRAHIRWDSLGFSKVSRNPKPLISVRAVKPASRTIKSKGMISRRPARGPRAISVPSGSPRGGVSAPRCMCCSATARRTVATTMGPRDRRKTGCPGGQYGVPRFPYQRAPSAFLPCYWPKAKNARRGHVAGDPWNHNSRQSCHARSLPKARPRVKYHLGKIVWCP